MIDVETSILWGCISNTPSEDKRCSPYLGTSKIVPSIHLLGTARTFLIKKGRLSTTLHGYGVSLESCKPGDVELLERERCGRSQV